MQWAVDIWDLTWLWREYYKKKERERSRRSYEKGIDKEINFNGIWFQRFSYIARIDGNEFIYTRRLKKNETSSIKLFTLEMLLVLGKL